MAQPSITSISSSAPVPLELALPPLADARLAAPVLSGLHATPLWTLARSDVSIVRLASEPPNDEAVVRPGPAIESAGLRGSKESVRKTRWEGTGERGGPPMVSGTASLKDSRALEGVRSSTTTRRGPVDAS
jgi:hypothetical protein